MDYAVTQSHLMLHRWLRHVRPSSPTTMLALALLLCFPVGLTAQGRGSACNGDITIGAIAFTGLPQGGSDPSDLLAYRMSSSKKPDGSIAPGTFWLCKPADSNSVGLILAELMGTPIASIRLEISHPNPTTQSMSIVLKDALVTSMTLTGTIDKLLDEVELLSCELEIVVATEDGEVSRFIQRCGPLAPRSN